VQLSKGIALLTIVKPLWSNGSNILGIVFGIIATLVFFGWGYMLDGGRKDANNL
jgi:type III secretory pathway component EscT